MAASFVLILKAKFENLMQKIQKFSLNTNPLTSLSVQELTDIILAPSAYLAVPGQNVATWPTNS